MLDPQEPYRFPGQVASRRQVRVYRHFGHRLGRYSLQAQVYRQASRGPR